MGTLKPVPLTQLGEGEGETAFKGRGSFTEPGSVDGWSYPEFEEQHILSHISGQTWLCVSRGQTPSHSTLSFFFPSLCQNCKWLIICGCFQQSAQEAKRSVRAGLLTVLLTTCFQELKQWLAHSRSLISVSWINECIWKHIMKGDQNLVSAMLGHRVLWLPVTL